MGDQVEGKVATGAVDGQKVQTPPQSSAPSQGGSGSVSTSGSVTGKVEPGAVDGGKIQSKP